MKKWIVSILALAMVALSLLGCASAYEDYAPDYYADAEYAVSEDSDYGYASEPAPAQASEEMERAAYEEDGGELAGGPAIDYDGSMLQPGVERKIIFSGEMSIQTTEFDADYNRIKSTLSEFGGYIESESRQGTPPKAWNDAGRTADFTLRVPSRRFDEFVNKMQGFGETSSISTRGTDVSLSYFDSETRLEMYRTREARLLELLEQAKGLEDIIELERELGNVAYQIQMLVGELRTYDSLIDYSTIYINLREVNQVERVTTSDKDDLGTRIKTGFFSVLNVLADIGEGLLVFFIAGSPVLVPLALIAVLIIVLVKRRNKKRKAQKTDTEN